MLMPNDRFISSETVRQYLDSVGIVYTVVDLIDSLPEEVKLLPPLIRGMLFKAKGKSLMAIVPDDRLLDVVELSQWGGQVLTIASRQEEIACIPLPLFLEVDALADKSILSLKEISFRLGLESKLVCMPRESFLVLLGKIEYGDFSIPVEALQYLQAKNKYIKYLTPLRVKQRVEQTFELPTIPLIATKILKLRSDPTATVTDLVKVIQLDPALSAELMSWAQSAYYGYTAAQVASLEYAIVKILGFELVINIALVISLGQYVKIPKEGPFGLREYWRFAIYTGALVEALVEIMPTKDKPPKGLAYLAGLLHNIGHLLLVRLFPSSFELLNSYASANPQISLQQIEHYVLGIDHDEIGTRLMQVWHLPKEVITAIKVHHLGNYRGEYAMYSHLVLLATYLLKNYPLVDPSLRLPPTSLALLGITQVQAIDVLNMLMTHRTDLLALLNQLVVSE